MTRQALEVGAPHSESVASRVAWFAAKPTTRELTALRERASCRPAQVLPELDRRRFWVVRPASPAVIPCDCDTAITQNSIPRPRRVRGVGVPARRVSRDLLRMVLSSR
jgi:hypothetical protein